MRFVVSASSAAPASLTVIHSLTREHPINGEVVKPSPRKALSLLAAAGVVASIGGQRSGRE